MLPAEVGIGVLPPAIAVLVVVGGFVLRWMKQRDVSKRSEWERMRDLLDELKDQRDAALGQVAQRDELIGQQAAHITQLRESQRQRDQEGTP